MLVIDPKEICDSCYHIKVTEDESLLQMSIIGDLSITYYDSYVLFFSRVGCCSRWRLCFRRI